MVVAPALLVGICHSLGSAKSSVKYIPPIFTEELPALYSSTQSSKSAPSAIVEELDAMNSLMNICWPNTVVPAKIVHNTINAILRTMFATVLTKLNLFIVFV